VVGLLLFLCLQQQRKSNQKSLPQAGLREKLHTFFLNDQKERTKCSLSFDRPKESEPKEKPSALLYRPIITPQHLWLDCYFFFVSSNKEKVTKKKMPPSAVFFYTHSLFTLSWYSSDLILNPPAYTYAFLMSLSIALFERQPQSIAVCCLYPLSTSQNTPSCYFASSALILKAFKGKTAEGEKATVVSINHGAVSVFLFFFFISSTYIIPAVVFTFGHCHYLSVECLAICTHRKILPAITPRNAGCISPRAHEAGGRMCEGRFSVLFP